jgi:uncharacterized OB-fold protein
MLHHVVSLDYERPPTAVARQYAQAIKEHRLAAHKCPECGRLYTPPRGYCPICVIPTGDEHSVDIKPVGVLTTYTVLNPDSLHAQGGESIVRGNVLLDGTKITIMGDLLDVKAGEVHTGMRMSAEFLDDPNAPSAGGGWGPPGIKGWKKTGEPDVSADEVQRLLIEAGTE